MSNSNNSAAKPGTPQYVELIDKLPDSLRDGVEEGSLEVLPGKDANKPVVRDAATGRLVKGSGQYPAAPNMGEVAKRYAHTRTNNYKEALNLLVPLDEGPDKKGSFAWWYEQLIDAAMGTPQNITCPQCGYNGIGGYKKDTATIFKLIEMKHGKAPQTSEVNVQNEHLIAILQQGFNPTDITVHDVDPDESNRRRQALIEEGEIIDNDEGTHTSSS